MLYNQQVNRDPSVLDYSQTDTEDGNPIVRKEVQAAVQSLNVILCYGKVRSAYYIVLTHVILFIKQLAHTHIRTHMHTHIHTHTYTHTHTRLCVSKM